MEKTTAVVLAAGEGKRLKRKISKAFVRLGGKPILYYSLKVFEAHPRIKEIILVVRDKDFKKAKLLVNKYKFKKIEKLVRGGKERLDSVINALKEVSPDTKYLLIHDSARPFLNKGLIDRVLKALKRYKAVIPGINMQDTLKEVDSQGIVRKTLKRENIRIIQTPQGFRWQVLKGVLENQERFKSAYDDASLIEDVVKVKVISSSAFNFKITTPYDLFLARFYLSLIS